MRSLRFAIATLMAASVLSLSAAQTASAGKWDDKTERTVGGPEADLVVRTGDINNLGFGWPAGFDPFTGKSTPSHGFPWTPPANAPAGTDRIMLGSAVTSHDLDLYNGDGYSRGKRSDNLPQPITLNVGELPAKVDAVLFQMFLDDFQAPRFHSHFQVSLNGTRIPNFEDAINALDQTGPIGKLVSLKLLPEYFPILRSGSVKLLIDDPTTHRPDGYAIDFVRILVNPHTNKNYQASLTCTVVDARRHLPVAGATVTAALVSATTDRRGHCALENVPAGLVAVSASAPGYDVATGTVDLESHQKGHVDLELRLHQEGTADLARAIQGTGSAIIYGLHFDTGSAKLRPDSAPALKAVLELIQGKPGSHWIIAGHTDNQGFADHNQKLSEARAASVISWLATHGVDAKGLVPRGFGATRPVADNAGPNGRALNRRVEIAPSP